MNACAAPDSVPAFVLTSPSAVEPTPAFAPAPAPRRDGVAIALAALALYALLAQETLYDVDGHFYMWRSLGGDNTHPWHFAYMALLGLARDVAALLGGTMHQAALALDALGAAVAVLFAHLACRRLGLTRAAAAGAAALLATAPAIVFFATVVELHTVFLALCGPAFVATAAVAVRPTLGRGVWLGAACGLAYAGHATGIVLPGMLFPIALVFAVERQGQAAWRGLRAPLLAGLAVHLCMVVGLPRVLQLLGYSLSTGETWDHFIFYFWEYLLQPWLLLHTTWHDWLRPLFPLSLFAFVGLWPRRTRWLTLASWVGIGGLLWVTLILMGRGTERGAYLLPMAWPAALIAVRLLSGVGAVVALALSLLVAVVEVKVHDARRPGLPFAEGFREVIGDRPCFLYIGAFAEAEGLLVYLPEVEWKTPLDEIQTDPRVLHLGLPLFDQFLLGKMREGKEVWITAGGKEQMRNPTWVPKGPSGPPLLEHIERRFRQQEARAKGFHAWRLLPRE